MSSRSRIIADIEALRAVAIVFTVIQHLPWLSPGGYPALNYVLARFQFWAGVDLFFCISGFVIGRSLFQDLARNTASSQWPIFRTFWIRRAFRILPAAWLWLAIIILLSIVWNENGSFKTVHGNINDAIAAIFQVANIFKWKCYADTSMICGVADVYWSLSLEEQFYLLFPLAIAVFGPRRLVPLLVVAILFQLFKDRPAGFDFANMTKSDAIMIGVVLAWFRDRIKVGTLAPYLVPLLIVLLAWIPAQPIHFRTGTISVIAGCLVYIAAADRDIICAKWKPLALYLGSRSYSLYLVHIPIFLAVKEATIELVALPAAVALMIAASEATYRFVEMPMRNFGRRLVLPVHIQRGEQTGAGNELAGRSHC